MALILGSCVENAAWGNVGDTCGGSFTNMPESATGFLAGPAGCPRKSLGSLEMTFSGISYLKDYILEPELPGTKSKRASLRRRSLSVSSVSRGRSCQGEISSLTEKSRKEIQRALMFAPFTGSKPQTLNPI